MPIPPPPPPPQFGQLTEATQDAIAGAVGALDPDMPVVMPAKWAYHPKRQDGLPAIEAMTNSEAAEFYRTVMLPHAVRCKRAGAYEARRIAREQERATRAIVAKEAQEEMIDLALERKQNEAKLRAANERFREVGGPNIAKPGLDLDSLTDRLATLGKRQPGKPKSAIEKMLKDPIYNRA